MSSNQEMRFQTLFCSDPETEALGADLWLTEPAWWNSDGLLCLGWFTKLLSLHLFSSLGKRASRWYVTWILNKVNENTLWKGIVYSCHQVRFYREWEKNPQTAILDSWNWSLPSGQDGSTLPGRKPRWWRSWCCTRAVMPWTLFVPHVHVLRTEMASGSWAELAKDASPNFYSSFPQSRSGWRFQTVLLALSESFFSHGERVNGVAKLPKQYSSFLLGTARGANFLGSSPLLRDDTGAPAALKSLWLPWSWRPSQGIYAA